MKAIHHIDGNPLNNDPGNLRMVETRDVYSQNRMYGNKPYKRRFVTYVPIPVDIDGQGPCESEDTFKTIHEVWDDCFRTIATCPDEESALMIVEALNARN